MIQEKDLDWATLENPAGCFTMFRPDKDNPIEFFKKLTKFEKMLKNRYLYLSDEYRNEMTIASLMQSYLYQMPFSIFYEIGDWQGMIGFTKIRPEHRCGFLFKIWDKKVFNKSLVRACRDLTNLYMDQFRLKRMAVESPDEDMVKGAKMLGFEVEGEEPMGFKWKGKFFTNFMLGKVREV